MKRSCGTVAKPTTHVNKTALQIISDFQSTWFFVLYTINILLSPLHTNYSNCHIKYIHSWIFFKNDQNDRTIETVKLILCLLLLYRTFSCLYWSTEVTSASIKQIAKQVNPTFLMVKITFWYQRRLSHWQQFCSKNQSNSN